MTRTVFSTARRWAVIPTVALALVACDDDDPVAPMVVDDIIDVVNATADVSTLQAALEAAGLTAALQGSGPFTVFAPRNAAFAALGDDVVAGLLEIGNADLLSKILTFHVVPGVAAFSPGLTDGQTVTTLQGEALTIGVSGSGVTVNGAAVVSADIEATNGVIHLIDGVLLPELDIVERATVTAETQTLSAAVVAGDLTATLSSDGPFTVFAPVEAAFAALGTEKLDVLLDPANQGLLQKILTYHVVPGDIRSSDLTDGAIVTTVEGTEVTIDLSGATPKVNGADIVTTDIVVGNGVIHLIEGVLLPEFDLFDTALLNGFTTLADLARTASLEETLRGDNGGNGFTVFAPTNDAFAQLASVPSGQALADVLTYHVIAGTVGSGDLFDGQVVTTVEGSTFTVNISGSAVTLTDGAGTVLNVVTTDVPATNGVVHVIDGVLLPN